MMADRLVQTSYGFNWKADEGKGWLRVTRLATIRGYKVIRVDGGDPENGVDVYVSPAGRKVRVFRNGQELSAGGES